MIVFLCNSLSHFQIANTIALNWFSLFFSFKLLKLSFLKQTEFWSFFKERANTIFTNKMKISSSSNLFLLMVSFFKKKFSHLESTYCLVSLFSRKFNALKNYCALNSNNTIRCSDVSAIFSPAYFCFCTLFLVHFMHSSFSAKGF